MKKLQKHLIALAIILPLNGYFLVSFCHYRMPTTLVACSVIAVVWLGIAAMYEQQKS
ncbi:MAG: hypothetical protein WC460_04125 [Patescibacteria group bacterium]